MIRGYEALTILKTAGTEEELMRHAARLDAHVKKLNGTIESSQHLGRRRLSFPIARQAEGHYYLVRFRAPTEQIAELERLFRLEEFITRFIILTQEEAAPLAMPSARQAGPPQSAAAPIRS